jgi:hemolysin activation/secretion protein
MNRAWGICAVVAVGSVLAATGASAQPRPGTLQPGQVERQLERPPEPSAKPGAITIPGAEQPRPANAPGIRFVLNELTIEGVTVYRPEALRRMYEPLLRQEVTLADVYALVDRLTARYRNDGYILSQVIVPAQAVDNGIVRLQAIEGYVASVQVQGGSAAIRERARKYGERIAAARPLTAATLERYVLLLNDLPGVTARAVLAPARTPGASDLVLQVSQGRYDGGVSTDTRGSKAQGLRRVLANADMHSLFGGASLTQVRNVTTLDSELFYISAAHEQYIGAGGGSLRLAGSYVYSSPQELSFIPLDLTTKSQMATLTYSYPVVRSRGRNLYVRGTLSSFDSTSTIFGIKDTADHLRAVRLGLTFDASDAIGGVNIADLEFSQGLSGLGASKNGDEYLSRAGGRSDFRRASLYGARFQALPANFSVVAAVNAQYAFTDLLAPELFMVGGELFGRGYDPSELLNDHGAALKLDLRYTQRMNNGRAALTPYVFYDMGRVWQRTTQPGLDASQSLASAGGGFRVNLGMRTAGFIEYAKPLTKIVALEDSRNGRVYAGFSIQ